MRVRPRFAAWVVVVGVGLAAHAADDEWRLPPEKTVLRPGPGREIVLGQCIACHSADYITTQPPLDRAGWTASIEKMRSKYGAPVPTNAMAPLTDYLTRQYGKTVPGR